MLMHSYVLISAATITTISSSFQHQHQHIHVPFLYKNNHTSVYLQPENFLLLNKDADAELKCNDFGLSVFFNNNTGGDTFSGKERE